MRTKIARRMQKNVPSNDESPDRCVRHERWTLGETASSSMRRVLVGWGCASPSAAFEWRRECVAWMIEPEEKYHSIKG